MFIVQYAMLWFSCDLQRSTSPISLKYDNISIQYLKLNTLMTIATVQYTVVPTQFLIQDRLVVADPSPQSIYCD